MNIKVNFEYLQPYLPTARSRKVRFDWREGVADIEIPEITDDEFPIVIKFNQTVLSLDPFSSIYRGYNNCLYVKEDYTEMQTSFPLSVPLRLALDLRKAAKKTPFTSASIPITDPQTLSEGDRKLLDEYGYEAELEELKKYFSSFVSFQGDFWRKSDDEPIIKIQPSYYVSIGIRSPETTIARYRGEYRLDMVKCIQDDYPGKKIAGLKKIERYITLHPDIASYLKLQYDESSPERGLEKYKYNLSTKSFEYFYHGRCTAPQTGCVIFKSYDLWYRWYYKGTDDEDTVLAAFFRDNPTVSYSKIISVCERPVK